MPGPPEYLSVGSSRDKKNLKNLPAAGPSHVFVAAALIVMKNLFNSL